MNTFGNLSSDENGIFYDASSGRLYQKEVTWDCDQSVTVPSTTFPGQTTTSGDMPKWFGDWLSTQPRQPPAPQPYPYPPPPQPYPYATPPPQPYPYATPPPQPYPYATPPPQPYVPIPPPPQPTYVAVQQPPPQPIPIPVPQPQTYGYLPQPVPQPIGYYPQPQPLQPQLVYRSESSPSSSSTTAARSTVKPN